MDSSPDNQADRNTGLDALVREAIQRARDRRSPSDVVLESGPEIVCAREQLREQMPKREWTDEESATLLRDQDEARDRIIREELIAGGYDYPLADDGVYEAYDLINIMVEDAERYDEEHGDREMAARFGWDPPERRYEYLDDPYERANWERIYRPSCSSRNRPGSPLDRLAHPSHRRVPAGSRRPAHRRHAARRAAGIRSGEDPGSDDPEPADPAPSQLAPDPRGPDRFFSAGKINAWLDQVAGHDPAAPAAPNREEERP